MKITTFTQDQIKAINRVNILSILRLRGETTKQEIAVELGLSIPTVTTNINQMMDEGYVLMAGVAKSTGGRKPMILQFEKNARYAFGVDLGSDHVRIVLVNLKMEILENITFECDWHLGMAPIMHKTSDQIEALIAKRLLDKNQILGAGISLPGLVDEDRLILENAPNIGVRDYDFTPLKDGLGIPVYIENEANIAAYAEATIGSGQDKHNMVYISITEGVGTGIIINDQIYKSTHKKAGEFGHMRVSDEPLRCNCGRTGCWELYASKKALLKFYENVSGKKVSKLEMIFDEVLKQDSDAIHALELYMEKLFIGIENIILGLNPEYVIIGGEITKYQSTLLEVYEKSQVLKSSYMAYEDTKILFSSLGDEAAAIGAALLPIDTVFSYHGSTI